MEVKKLKEIAKQLRAASAMHKGQAAKIDRMLKSMSSKKKMSKLTKRQKKIAKAAPPYDKITGADFKSLKSMNSSKKSSY